MPWVDFSIISHHQAFIFPYLQSSYAIFSRKPREFMAVMEKYQENKTKEWSGTKTLPGKN